MSENDSMIGVPAVAKMLDVSPRTVQRWIFNGEIIEPYRVGGLLRWKRSAVLEWIESTKQTRPASQGEVR